MIVAQPDDLPGAHGNFRGPDDSIMKISGTCWQIVVVTQQASIKQRKDSVVLPRAVSVVWKEWNYRLQGSGTLEQQPEVVFGPRTLGAVADMGVLIKEPWSYVAVRSVHRSDYASLNPRAAVAHFVQLILQVVDGDLRRMLIFGHVDPPTGLAKLPGDVHNRDAIVRSTLLNHLPWYDQVHVMPDVNHFLANPVRVSTPEFDTATFAIVAISFKGTIVPPKGTPEAVHFTNNMGVLRGRVQDDPVSGREVVSQRWSCYQAKHRGHQTILVTGDSCPRSVPHFCKAVALLKAMLETNAKWLLFRDLDAFVASDKMELPLSTLTRNIPDDCHFVVTSSLDIEYRGATFINSCFFFVRHSHLGKAILEHWWEQAADPTRYTADFDQISLKHTMLTFINATRARPPYYENEIFTCKGKYASPDRFPCRHRFQDVLLKWGYSDKSRAKDPLIRPFCRVLGSTTTHKILTLLQDHPKSTPTVTITFLALVPASRASSYESHTHSCNPGLATTARFSTHRCQQ